MAAFIVRNEMYTSIGPMICEIEDDAQLFFLAVRSMKYGADIS